MAESEYIVIIQPSAERDMELAYLWLLENVPHFASEWFDSILYATTKLSHFPERCPKAPENRSAKFSEEIRELFHGKGKHIYRILFWINDQTVHVIHVRHGARKWVHQKDEDFDENFGD